MDKNTVIETLNAYLRNVKSLDANAGYWDVRNLKERIESGLKTIFGEGNEFYIEVKSLYYEVPNFNGYKRERKILERILQSVIDYTNLSFSSTPPVQKSYKRNKIFISHSVRDKELVQRFTEDILQIGLGLNPKEHIFNISIEDTNIKNGEDFRKRIETELKHALVVVQIITENYKNSEACLNEMGAAWILEMPVVPFILSPITYNTVGFIHITNQQPKLNSKDDLLNFVAEIKSILKLDYHDGKLHRKISDFLTFVGQLSKTDK